MKYFQDCKNQVEIKKKYRELAKKYHPDLNKGMSGEVMKEVNREYELATGKSKPPVKRSAPVRYSVIVVTGGFGGFGTSAGTSTSATSGTGGFYV